MQQEITKIEQEFQEKLACIENLEQLESVRQHFLGKKGPVQSLMPLLRQAPKQERPFLGKEINRLKTLLENSLSDRHEALYAFALEQQIAQEVVDISLPGRTPRMGRKHPLTQLLDRILGILSGMGFSVQSGPDIDTDYYNFEVLNFAKDHPARDEHDTYYVQGDVLLRTQTSNVQARVMEREKLPIRVVSPGKCYRNETITSRSHVQFHQVEGFYIDEGVTLSDLLSTLDELIKKLFGDTVRFRVRSSYFPFVEPGIEVDIGCLLCGGSGCSVCKGSGWLEVLGAGMIHPEVLKNVGIDPERYTGYAWGMGLERLVMIEKGIKDLRLFMENDVRFLEQFHAL